MKIQPLNILALVSVTCICTFAIARGQTSPNDLTVNAEAQILQDTNETKVFLTIHLVNSTDHEVTVLTKHLNARMDGSANRMTFAIYRLREPRPETRWACHRAV